MYRFEKKISILLVCIFFVCPVISQDGLSSILKKSYDDLILLENSVSSLDSLSRVKYALAKKFLKKDIDQSVILFDEAIQMARKVDDEKFTIQILKSKAIAMINLQQTEEARKLIQIATDYYKRTGEEAKYASSLLFYSYLFTTENNYPKALQYALEALEISINIGNEQEIQNANNRIGIIYGHLGEDEKSLKYFEKNIVMGRKHPHKFMYRASLSNAGEVYLRRNNLVKAEEYLHEALTLRRLEKSPKNLAYAYGNLADLNLIKGNDSIALKLLDSSELLFRKTNFKQGVAEVLVKKTQLLKESSDHQAYKNSVITTQETLSKWGIKNNEESILEAYADILFEDGKVKEAYANLKKSKQLQKDLNSEKKVKQIQLLENRLKEEEEQSKFLALSKEVSLKNIQNKYLTILFGLGVALILLLLFSNRLRRKKNQEISSNLKDKELLIKEIHHRVKNNLQIVSSMLNLQSRNIEDGSVKMAIIDNRDRVKSMALLHQRLYEGHNLKGVKLREYIENLLSNLLHSYQLQDGELRMVIDVDEVILDLDSAIPVALIVNELVTNAFKYAFIENGLKSLEVRLNEVDGKLILKVKDNGGGIDPQGLSEGFGYQLVRSLSRKLKGEIKIQFDNGFEVIIIFHKFKKIKS